MWYAILALVGLIMTGEIHAEENRVTVRGLNQRLQLTGWQSSWQVGGEIVPPVHPLPGGLILAIVKAREGDDRTLVLWNKEGKEQVRSSLSLAGDLMAARTFGKRLIAASASEVTEFDLASLRLIRTRKFSVPIAKTTSYLPGPTGLWVANEHTLSYFDLDGAGPLTKTRPLAAVSNKPLCPANGQCPSVPCSGGFQPQKTEMLVSDAGELLILDVFMEKYPVKIESQLSDQVWPSTVTVLDTKGNILTQKPFSWMKTQREWFWSVRVSQNWGPFPNDWGVVRTRYKTDGVSIGDPLASRGTDFLFCSGSDEMVVRRVDHRLETLWKRSLRNLVAPVVSPSWASPLLFHDGICHKFSTISEHGTGKEEKNIEIVDLYLELERNNFIRPHLAIGQSTEGDWLLIAY